MGSDTCFDLAREDSSGMTMAMGLRASAGLTADTGATMCAAYAAVASSDPIRTTTI